jgi:hypothetical protein
MGVFDALPNDGSGMKAKDLAEHVKADPALLGMIKTSQNLRKCLLTDMKFVSCDAQPSQDHSPRLPLKNTLTRPTP